MHRLTIAIALLLLTGCSVLQAQTISLEEDFQLMRTWFEGEFDNFQQVWKENEDSIRQELRHEHIHSIVKRVEIPKLGEYVFFVKQYQDGDTSNIYRQKVYKFHLNKEENAIQLDIYSFLSPKAEKQYQMANYQPELLKDLSTKDFRNTPGCAVYWRKNGDHFVGYMKEKACFFHSRRSNKNIYVTDSLKLTQDEIWIRDEAYDEDGNYVFGNKAGILSKLKRCRFFEGWMAVQKPESEDYYFMRNINLHDQGQKVQLIDKDGSVTPYYIELSEVIYPTGLEVMKLAIYEEGKDKAVAYVWTNPDAKRIGINMRSITAGFAEKED
ncbi:MAG: chromophore lyase CpcT/CpeT [Bacteroidota bacterium]